MINAGSFGKTKIFLGIIGFIWVFSTVVLAIIGSSIYFAKTGDVKPLLQDTGGMIIGADASIHLAVKELLKKDINKEYSDYLKSKILQSFALFVAFFIVLYIIIQKIFGIFIPSDSMNVGLKALFFLMALVILTAMSVLYNGIMLHLWSFNPYSGMTSLVKNYDILLNVGNESIVRPLVEAGSNSAINNTGVANV